MTLHATEFSETDTAPMGAEGDAANFDYVVIGAGPAGLHLSRSLSQGNAKVALLSAERISPYNRVLLTPLLADEVQLGAVVEDPTKTRMGARVYTGIRVTSIDTEGRRLTTSAGRIFGYRKLAICVGSRPFVPPIPGHDASNVFTFREAGDVEALKARSFSARKVVVIGGGLLGLEAARGMSALGAETCVVEHEARLMPRQLDAAASNRLAGEIAELGIKTIIGQRVAEIEAPYGRASHVRLADDTRLDADTVVICTGVRPETTLAREAGLTVNRGIVVGPDMATSDPNIYAAGECVECMGEIEGLVGPCLAQAKVAAASMHGDALAYERIHFATKLKIVGVDVFSMGPVESLEQLPAIQSRVWRDNVTGQYRRLFVRRDGTLLGAIGIGPWEEVNRVQQAISDGQSLPFLSRWRFARAGRIWGAAQDDSPIDWPETAVVCNCTGVTRGQIGAAIDAGAASVPDIRSEIGAGSVCGTCQPLLTEILGGDTPPEPVRFWKTLTGLSLIGAVLALITALAPPIPFSTTFNPAGLFEYLWQDNIAKQWSGYILLGCTTAAALIGLRKRIRFLDRLGGYDWWRGVHLGIGAATGLVLFAHTGFRLGANLTFVLMAAFLGTLLFGAIAGWATGQDHMLTEKGYSKATKPARRLPIWAHILLLWPLPLLIAAHVLSVYAY